MEESIKYRIDRIIERVEAEEYAEASHWAWNLAYLIKLYAIKQEREENPPFEINWPD